MRRVPCETTETCTNSDGGYSCSDRDECADGSNHCKTTEKCINREGGFDCIDRDECADGTHTCSENEQCANREGGFDCVKVAQLSRRLGSAGCDFMDSYGECQQWTYCGEEGYALDKSTNTCEDVDECAKFCQTNDTVTDAPQKMVQQKRERQGKILMTAQPEATTVDSWCREPVCGADNICTNTIGSYTCTEGCRVEKCGPFEECRGNKCACEDGTIDIQKFDRYSRFRLDGARYPQRCIAKKNDQIAFIEWWHGENSPRSQREVPAMIRGCKRKCPHGFKPAQYNKAVCVDIDECQKNNGGCIGMCWNYFGTHRCYEDMGEELDFCHHEGHAAQRVLSNGAVYGASCECYEGHELCEDQFTCTCTHSKHKVARSARYNKSRKPLKKHSPLDRDARFKQFVKKQRDQKKIQKSHLGSMLSSSVRQCPAGQHSHHGICYKVFYHAKWMMSLDDAEAKCRSIGAKLAEIQDRESWWVLMMLMGDGVHSFWISENSSAHRASMYVVDADNVQPARQGMLANLAQDYRQVSPQWDLVDRRQRHRFVCQFD